MGDINITTLLGRVTEEEFLNEWKKVIASDIKLEEKKRNLPISVNYEKTRPPYNPKYLD